MKPFTKALVCVAVLTSAALIGTIIVRLGERRQSSAQALLKEAAPEIHERLVHTVSRLEEETTAQSLAKLADVELFYWPGPDRGSGSFGVRDLPLDVAVGGKDIEAICSNRRFCKLFEEAVALDKAVIAKMVNGEIDRFTADYLKLYNDKLQEQAPNFKTDKLEGRQAIAGPGFVTGNVKDGEIVIAGARLKILALVSLCGALKLTECRTNMGNIARIALKQREEMYSDASLHPFFRSQMLKRGSLYNRQIIGAAFLEMKDEASRTAIMKELGLEWSESKLPSFKAALTEFDLPAKSGVLEPDYSLGSRPLRFLAPLDDTQFDKLLRRCGVEP